jgi:glutamine synthetase
VTILHNKYSFDDIYRIVKDEDVNFIRLQFTDIFGTLKNVAITKEQLDKALNNKCVFDGSSIEGFVRIEESDMCLWPDLNTFQIFPWRPSTGKVARFICDVHYPDGKPFEGDPRYILKKAVKRAKDMGYELVNFGPECEFFLFFTDSDGNPTTNTHDNASYFDLGPVDLGENARREMCMILEDMGFEIEASHHEVAPGQHEIDFKHSDAVSTADAILTFKLVVKTIAQRNGLHATFMPKPKVGLNGSGMHTNIYITKNGSNAFYDKNKPDGLSDDAKFFIGGLISHVREITAIANPLVNSYKRMMSDFEAPVYVAWSGKSRSPLIRIPSEREDGTRLELRNPDSACNPYLTFAAILSAGLDGISKKIQPPLPVDENIFKMTDLERKQKGIEKLPVSLTTAIEELEKSVFMKDVLGDHIFYKYIEAKKKEWEDYSLQISSWEIEQYLRRF